jgi:hypothetical protein
MAAVNTALGGMSEDLSDLIPNKRGIFFMNTRRLFCLLVGIVTFSDASAATYLYFNSEPGDYIGGGQEQTWTEDDGIFSISRNFDEGVSVDFNGTDWWYLDFAGPGDVELSVGPYENAERFPFQSPTLPGLSVSGNGRGCNTLTGRFDILEVEYDPSGNVVSFAADFEQHCEGDDPALFGSIHYNSSIGAAPQVNITANGSQDPIIVQEGEPVLLSATIEAADRSGEDAEVWFGLQGPYSNVWHNGAQLAGRTLPYYVGPLMDQEEQFNIPFLQPGIYLGVLAVDMDVDKHLGTEYTDYIVITVK